MKIVHFGDLSIDTIDTMQLTPSVFCERLVWK